MGEEEEDEKEQGVKSIIKAGSVRLEGFSLCLARDNIASVLRPEPAGRHDAEAESISH